MARGTKKTVGSLEQLFETYKKPTQQDFFDLFASFYHKDEDISFLINIAKATQTDVQTGIENNRFMTALRTYQSILWWVRLARHPLLMMDVQELITNNINQTLADLLAVDDADNIINTLGELYKVFKDFNEEEGGINALRNRIIELESILFEVPGQQRAVQDTFDSLFGLVNNAQNTANNATTLANNAQASANNAQAKADDAWNRANNAQNTANNATTLANNAQASANNAQAKADDAWNRANNAQAKADSAWNMAYTNAADIDILDPLVQFAVTAGYDWYDWKANNT